MGSMLRIVAYWAQKQAGVSFSTMENTRTDLPHVESQCSMSIRTFLGIVDRCMMLDEPTIAKRQHEQDAHIMDLVLESEWFSDKEMREINHCRMHLGVELISDVSCANGGHLDKVMVSGELSLFSSMTKHKTIHQVKPHPPTWLAWQKTMTLFSANGRSHNKLGHWNFPHAKLHRR